MSGFFKVFEIVKKIIGILDISDKRKTLLIMLDIILAAVLETASVGLIIPLISVITTPEKISSNPIIAILLESFHIYSNTQLILIICIILALFYVIKNLFLIISSLWQNTFRYNLQTKLSVKMLKAYLSHPYLFFVNTNSAEIMRGIGPDIGCVKDTLEVLFNSLTQGLTLVFISVFLFYTDFLMAFVFLTISLVCVLFLVYGLKRKVSILGTQQRIGEANTTKYSRELLDGIKEIYAIRKQNQFLDTYRKAFSAKSKVNIAYYTILDIPNRIIETSFIIGIVAIIIVRVIMGVELTAFVPRLAAFALAGIKILPSMATISKSITQLIFQKPGLDEAYDNIIKYENVKAQIEPAYAGEKKFETLQLKGVRWKYAEDSDDVIKGVDLTINAGDSIALIGESGSGKTTIVDLMLGLYKPQQGLVTINGIDIAKYNGDWNKLVAYVQQNVFLLDDTIRRNIAFGEEEDSIDDARVWRAIEAAQLDAFVKETDSGLDTIVGERGVKFSGGQRQRVAIARALYFDSDIVVFDEATAALDNSTEKAVMEAIDSLQGKKTLIIVAHRLSTIRNCDKIYEVKDGQLHLRKWDEIQK